MTSVKSRCIAYILIFVLLASLFPLNIFLPGPVHASCGNQGSGRFGKSSGSSEPNGYDNRMIWSKEPVNLSTGRYLYQHKDLYIPGRGLPLTITRTYNSGDNYNGPFGFGWTFNYNLLLTANPSELTITAMTEDGRRDVYKSYLSADMNRVYGFNDKLVYTVNDTYSIERKDGTTRLFDYEGRLAAIKDRNGNVITFERDRNGNLIQLVDTSLRTLDFAYDNAGRITAINDWIGRSWRYNYNEQGYLIQYTDPMGNQTKYNYDKDHQMTSITDALGNQIVANEYNIQGRVIKQADASGAITIFEYDISNKQTAEIDAMGRKTLYTYNEHWYETSRKDALGNTTEYSYDKNGNRNSITDANTNTSKYEYDDRGNILQITDALGNVAKMIYDTRDNLTSLTDALGHKTVLEYDHNSNLIRGVNAAGSTTEYTYDQDGQRIEMTSPNGSISKYTYDSNGNLLTRTDSLGNETSYTYDAAGCMTKETDANGNTTAYSYDMLGQLNKVTDALGSVVIYTYDANGNMTTIKDANGHTTNYIYDAFNRLKLVTDPAGNSTNCGYDSAGNKISATDANGKSTRYSYDALNRLSQIDYPDGTLVKYSYDNIGNRLSMTDSHGITKYEYDKLNRLTKVAYPGSDTISYQYDALGNRIGLIYPDGKAVYYDYDATNRLIQVKDQENMSTNYQYDLHGNLLTAYYSNGTRTEFAYDKSNRLLRLSNSKNQKIVSSYDYALDRVGNRIKVTEQFGAVISGPLNWGRNLEPGMQKALESSANKLKGTDPLNTTYEYDKLYRLVSVSYPFDVTVNYDYDPMGNRTRMTTIRGSDKNSVNYVYDSADRLLKAGDIDYHYDLNGNLVGKKAKGEVLATYKYDAANRLTSADIMPGQNQAGFLDKILALFSGPSQRISVSYEYDGDGNRINKSVSSATKTETHIYIWDINSLLPQVITDTTEIGTSAYTRGIGLISITKPDGEQQYYSNDGLGSVRNLTDNKGDTQVTYFYDVFGQNHLTIGSPNSNFLFTGEQTDDETGLIYLRARYYAPVLGRFISKDSFEGDIFTIQGLNDYSYAWNNPIGYSDPSGYCPDIVTNSLRIAKIGLLTANYSGYTLIATHGALPYGSAIAWAGAPAVGATIIGAFALGFAVGYVIAENTGLGNYLGSQLTGLYQ